jgi:PAS domain S-box-containing protein
MDHRETYSRFDSVAWAVLDARADAVTLVDLKGTIIFLNASAAQRFSKPPEEIIGVNVWEIYPRVYRSHHKILFQQVVQTNRPITVTNKDKERWCQTLFLPIHGKDDQIESIALCVSDVTAQINAEERLKQVLLELITAQDDERHRISQDLHDDVGQKMTALVFQLKTMRGAVEEDQVIPLKEINTVIGNMELIIKHVRQIFYTLYPPSLHQMPLPIVLAGFCSTFEEMNNMNVDFSCQEGFPDLPENFVNAIYRFVQEGLTNVSKHAKASSVWINLDYIDNDLTLSLEDNGQGFDLEKMNEGIGLHGIRQRFSMLGGGIEIESAPGKGTRLSGTIPFKANDQ